MDDLRKEMDQLRRDGGQNAINAYSKIRKTLLDNTGSKTDLIAEISCLMELYGALSVASAIKLLATQKRDLMNLIEGSCNEK